MNFEIVKSNKIVIPHFFEVVYELSSDGPTTKKVYANLMINLDQMTYIDFTKEEDYVKVDIEYENKKEQTIFMTYDDYNILEETFI